MSAIEAVAFAVGLFFAGFAAGAATLRITRVREWLTTSRWGATSMAGSAFAAMVLTSLLSAVDLKAAVVAVPVIGALIALGAGAERIAEMERSELR